MVVVGMRPMPPKAIEIKAYLQARSFSKLSKDHGPKRHPNTWRREESKEIRDSMKMENGSVHRIRYNGYCMKQWIRIPKVT